MLEDSARLTSLICGTEPLNRIWSPRATIQRMLDVEAALARALAAQQVIPAAAVAPIERACDASRLDADALAHGAALGGNLAIPLVRQLTAQVKADDPEAAKFVHWGATSQDIIDTPPPCCSCATRSTCSSRCSTKHAHRSRRSRAPIARRR